MHETKFAQCAMLTVSLTSTDGLPPADTPRVATIYPVGVFNYFYVYLTVLLFHSLSTRN